MDDFVWVKERCDENGVKTFEYPPVNKVLEDGSIVFNYNLDENSLLFDGYEKRSPSEVIDCQSDDENGGESNKSVFSKLAIRRAMRSLGMEERLDALLASNEVFAKDWADAQEIDLADEVFMQGVASAGVTSEEIEEIKNVASGEGE